MIKISLLYSKKLQLNKNLDNLEKLIEINKIWKIFRDYFGSADRILDRNSNTLLLSKKKKEEIGCIFGSEF